MAEDAPPVLRKRHIAAAVVGNALEFYDFTTYAYFAVQIGQAFFPSHDSFMSLMGALITFGAGFVMRPVGGIVIGHYSDRVGRKPAMLLSFALMGAGVLGLALTPSYATIGIAAPIIVVAIRMVQGFALGGDVGPTTAVLLEAAPPERRGLYGSLQFSSQGLATLLAGIAGVILANILNAAQLQSFGWRIAFGLGAIVIPVGLIIRRQLPETLHAGTREALTRIPASREVIRTAILGLCMIMGATTGFYVVSYLSTYAQTVLHMAANVSFTSTLMFGAINLVFSTLAGFASDKFGRKPVMVGLRIAMLITIYPAFYLLVHEPDVTTLLVATALLGLFSQASGAAAFVALAEAIPKRMRCAILALVYAIGVAVFGGTTQAIVTWLMHATGDIYAPAHYLFAGSLIALIAMLLMEETAHVARGGKSEAVAAADLGM